MYNAVYIWIFCQDTTYISVSMVEGNLKRMTVFDDLEMLQMCQHLHSLLELGSVINDKLSSLIVQIRASHEGTASR